MHPLDDVVAHVHRIDTFGQELNPVGVLVAGRLEGLVPPARALEQRGAHGLGRTAIEVVDNRLDGLADRGGRVFLLEPMAPPEIHDQRVTNRCRVVGEAAVVVTQPDHTGTRIVGQRLVVVVREANKRVMDMHGQRRGVGHDGWQIRPRRATDQRDDRFHFGIVRERLRAWQEYRGA